MATGAFGCRSLYPLLTRLGRSDLAAILAAQDYFPSPGWWVTQGATMAWES